MLWAMQVTLLDQRQWYQCACEGALPAFLWLTGLSGSLLVTLSLVFYIVVYLMVSLLTGGKHLRVCTEEGY